VKILSIMDSLLKLGVHVSGKQYELLKWRLSPEGKKYYTRQENKEFYKSLKKGNLDIVDAIRKEKQERINKLKQQLMKIVIVLFCLCIAGCYTIPETKTWDVNSLKDSERTFRIKEQTIKVDGKWESVKFDEGWYIVSQDHIKTFNENQDDLISVLTQLKERKKYEMFAGGTGVLVLLLFTVLRRRKDG